MWRNANKTATLDTLTNPPVAKCLREFILTKDGDFGYSLAGLQKNAMETVSDAQQLAGHHSHVSGNLLVSPACESLAG